MSPTRSAFGVLALCGAAFLLFYWDRASAQQRLQHDLAAAQQHAAYLQSRLKWAEDGLHNEKRRVDKIFHDLAAAKESNRATAASSLSPPDTSTLEFVPPSDAREWSPITARFVDGVPCVQATVCGRVGWFILDTGCSETVFDQAWAARTDFFLTPTEPTNSRGTQRIYVDHGATVNVGPASISRNRFWCYDFGPMSAAMGVPLCGAVGGDFFAKYQVRVRASEQRVDVGAPSTPILGIGIITIPIFLRNTRPFTTITISQKSSPVFGAAAMIDTGFAGHLSCPTRWSNCFNIEADAEPVGKVCMLGGPKSFQIARDLRASAGALCIGPTDAHVLELDNDDGPLIGAQALSAFTVIIDYPRRHILLVPPGINTD